MEVNLEKIKSVYFIGIGGIGVSAVARLMSIYGKKVAGSDSSPSLVTEQLSKLGIKIYKGHDEKNIPKDTDLLVHTIAVQKNNQEMLEAKRRKIQTITYPEMLSIISKNTETIAVSGTNGKTTTTAMLAKVMMDAKLDPTVIVGSLMKDSDSNLTVGKSKYFLVEACEYRRSFLNLYPKILVITNIDLDHLDYYKDIKDIQSAFRTLALRVPVNGAIICNTSDAKLRPVIKGLKCKIIDYGQYKKPELKLKSPGEHNRQNAAAVSAAAEFLGMKKKTTNKSLERFSGTWRRFDLKGKTKNGTLIYDDYAHNPQKIKSTLSGLKEKYPSKRRVVFFQPHLFSRTKLLLKEFSSAFNDGDIVYILPIFAAREKLDRTINSSMLVSKIIKQGIPSQLLESPDRVLAEIRKLNQHSVVMMMGAGDIYKLSELILKKC